MKRRDILLYKSFQILDGKKGIHRQGIPTLRDAKIELELMAKEAEKLYKVKVERINPSKVIINGTVFYIFNSTPRVQY
jgi:hypothetical protein